MTIRKMQSLFFLMLAVGAVCSEKKNSNDKEKDNDPFDFFDDDDFFGTSSNKNAKYEKKEGDKKKDFFSDVDFYGMSSDKDEMYGPFSYLTEEMRPEIPDPPKYKPKPTTTTTPPPPPPPPPKGQKYAFAYGVNDVKSGTNFNRAESSDGKGMTGQYKVHMPDGRIQTVNYKADHNGFQADIAYDPIKDFKPREQNKPPPKEQSQKHETKTEAPEKLPEITPKVTEQVTNKEHSEKSETLKQNSYQLQPHAPPVQEEKQTDHPIQSSTLTPAENIETKEKIAVTESNVDTNPPPTEITNAQSIKKESIEPAQSLKDLPGPPYSLENVQITNQNAQQPQNVVYTITGRPEDISPDQTETTLVQESESSDQYATEIANAQLNDIIFGERTTKSKLERAKLRNIKTKAPKRILPKQSQKLESTVKPHLQYATIHPSNRPQVKAVKKFPTTTQPQHYIRNSIPKPNTLRSVSTNKSITVSNTPKSIYIRTMNKFYPTVLPTGFESKLSTEKLINLDTTRIPNKIIKNPSETQETRTRKTILNEKKHDGITTIIPHEITPSNQIHHATTMSQLESNERARVVQTTSENPFIHISSTLPTKYRTEASSSLIHKVNYANEYANDKSHVKYVSPSTNE